jgi:L-lysine exporter family protein LysE/ArgO
MNSALTGFSLSLSLILVIGAQNAFVLRQGIRGEHVFAVALTCALSDAILIFAGVAGFGVMVERASWIEPLFRYGGAAFLIFYGTTRIWSACRGSEALTPSDIGRRDLGQTLATCLALTWLNPHVYLDTLVLLGALSAQAEDQVAFGMGAVAASVFFFFALAYGARLLAPVFVRPVTWRILDLAIAAVMWGIAVKILA